MITKACVNNDILTFVIPVKKSGNTCPYEVNFVYDDSIFEFYSINSMYGNYNAANKKLSISALYHGMQFDITFKLKVIDVTKLPATLGVNIPYSAGCDTIINNNEMSWDIIKAAYPDCPRNCEDLVASCCAHDYTQTYCNSIPYSIVKLGDCYLCNNGFTTTFNEVTKTNIITWKVENGYLYVLPIDPTVQWTITLNTVCSLGSCVQEPSENFTIYSAAPNYAVVYYIDGDNNHLNCDSLDWAHIYVNGYSNTHTITNGNDAALISYLAENTDVTNLCWIPEACAYIGNDSNTPGTSTAGTKYFVPFVDLNNDCPGFCDEDTIDYSKLTSIDLTPYGGTVVNVANNAAVIAAFAALDTPLTVTVFKCGVLISNWVYTNTYPDVEVVHATAAATVYVQDGDSHNLTYSQLYTPGFSKLYLDLSAYGGSAYERFANGIALKNRMIALTGSSGWVWQESSGGNYARLYNPALTTAITVTNIPSARIIQLIDTDESIVGTGINNNGNGNVGTVINYDVFTQVDFSTVGGTTQDVHTEVVLLTKLGDLGHTAEVYRGDILITNWATGTGYGNLEVNFNYDCWEATTTCYKDTSNSINVNAIDYAYPATTWAVLPTMLASLGIPGFVAASYNSTLHTIKIVLKQGYTSGAITIDQDCGTPTLTFTRTSTSSTPCVTI